MNPNAQHDLEVYAGEHGVDLEAYRSTLGSLRATGRFVDIDQPFAEQVLALLRTGWSIGDAVEDVKQDAVQRLTGG